VLFSEDLRPERADAEKQLGSNSVDLFWHSEDAHFANSCDFIMLICIRGDRVARTLLSLVKPENLPKHTLKALTEPWYQIFPDDSFSNVSRPRSSCAVFSSAPGGKLRFDPMFTICSNPEAFAALRCLNDLINEQAISVCLEPGDLLIIDNRRCVHARTRYQPRFDGWDRWLQRMSLYLSPPPAHLLEGENEPIIRF
jgi:L-asparagine oxygenase